jgi:hypothetical protein
MGTGTWNIDGNEQADKAAKMAATPTPVSPTTRMRSAQKRSIQAVMKTKWEPEWRAGKETAKRPRNIPEPLPDPSYVEPCSNRDTWYGSHDYAQVTAI